MFGSVSGHHHSSHAPPALLVISCCCVSLTGTCWESFLLLLRGDKAISKAGTCRVDLQHSSASESIHWAGAWSPRGSDGHNSAGVCSSARVTISQRAAHRACWTTAWLAAWIFYCKGLSHWTSFYHNLGKSALSAVYTVLVAEVICTWDIKTKSPDMFPHFPAQHVSQEGSIYPWFPPKYKPLKYELKCLFSSF